MSQKLSISKTTYTVSKEVTGYNDVDAIIGERPLTTPAISKSPASFLPAFLAESNDRNPD